MAPLPPVGQARQYNDMKRRNADRIKIRREAWQPPKASGRKPYSKARPEKWKWGDVPTNAPHGTFGRLAITGTFSKMRRAINNVAGVPATKMERWWCIENGVLPEDERAQYPIPTDEEMAERAEDELAALEAATNAKIEGIEQETQDLINKLHAEAMQYEADDNPETRRASLRHSERLREDAEEAAQEGRAQVIQEGEYYKLVRDEVKATLKKEQAKAIEEAAERVKKLKDDLADEIETWVNASYFTQEGFVLDTYTLT